MMECRNMTQTSQQPTCAERMKSAKDSRLDDIRIMLNPTEGDVILEDDGSLDTVLSCGDETFRYSDTSAYRDEDTGELNLSEFIECEAMEDIRERMYEAWHEYGLSFDYVAPNTFKDQPEGYFRYQLSWGGPSEEIRFYCNPDFSLHRAEFWYLDWFDGASITLRGDDYEIATTIHQFFDDCGSLQHTFDEATRHDS